jgi:hypothetical protein
MGRSLTTIPRRRPAPPVTPRPSTTKIVLSVLATAVLAYLAWSAMHHDLPDVIITTDECVIAHENGMGDARVVVAIHHDISTSDAGELILDQCF